MIGGMAPCPPALESASGYAMHHQPVVHLPTDCFWVVLTAFRDWTKQFRNFLSPTVLTCRQFCSHHRHGQNKTVLSCPCGRCKLCLRETISYCWSIKCKALFNFSPATIVADSWSGQLGTLLQWLSINVPQDPTPQENAFQTAGAAAVLLLLLLLLLVVVVVEFSFIKL